MYKVCFDTEESALADGSAFEELRALGIEIEKYADDDALSSQVLSEEEA